MNEDQSPKESSFDRDLTIDLDSEGVRLSRRPPSGNKKSLEGRGGGKIDTPEIVRTQGEGSEGGGNL